MRIVLREEMQAVDRHTIDVLGISPSVLMENAGRASVQTALEFYGTPSTALVLCGPGNNGGDGFAAARLLRNLGVRVAICEPLSPKQTGGAREAHRGWYQKSGGEYCSVDGLLMLQPEMIFDALFGIGFKGKLPSSISSIVSRIAELRESGTKIIALDLPSGVPADADDSVHVDVVQADLTVAFQYLKPAHVILPWAKSCGTVVVRDIGISSDGTATNREFITCDSIERIMKGVSDAGAHKGSRGHVAILGGSSGKFGAPILSGITALRSGGGLVTLCLPPDGMRDALASYPELMSLPLMDAPPSEEEVCHFRAALSQILSRERAALVCGPGLGEDERAKRYLSTALDLGGRLVVDADALNLLSSDKSLLRSLPKGAVLTPHPGEMARLMGQSVAEVESDRVGAALALALRTRGVVVLKGARTVIASSDGRVWINPAASEVLATAGSGDVLAGLIGALLARGFSAEDAARVACYAHGAVGERRRGEIAGLSASILLDELPAVLNLLVAGSRLPKPAEDSDGFTIEAV